MDGVVVEDVNIGNEVGVGVISDSCMDCNQCSDGEEQACEKGVTMTYNNDTVHGHIQTGTGFSQGGYSGSMTVHRRYIVKVPMGYPLEKTGPILCAGITMYSPLRHWNCLGGGKRVGVVGIGGLGQMGVRLAKAMGNSVTAVSTSPHKEQAAREIGADNFVVSTNADSMAAAANSCDLVINTVAANHDINTYLPLLAPKGVIVQIGVVLNPQKINQLQLMMKKLTIAGCMIGGLPETQDCIDFCHKHNIVPKIKMVTCDELDELYKALEGKNDSIIRNVLDIEASKKIRMPEE